MGPVLEKLERYYDAVPRADAGTEQIGPFTLFVRDGAGWPYYARPSLGARGFAAYDVSRVRERQRELVVPEAFEWVDEVSPSLARAAVEAGLDVHRHPLMLLEGEVRAGEPPPGADIQLLEDPDDLPFADAVQRLAFDEPGTQRGPAGLDELRAAVSGADNGRLADTRAGFERGLMRWGIARVDGAIVCAGGHKPVGDTSEIVGVGTLPAYRRRGLAGAVTAALARDARSRGVTAVFLSAGDDDVARLYGSLGFVRVGTACIAEPPG
jgi:ribosomal protein S18 acetylase RimI-like enzyme